MIQPYLLSAVKNMPELFFIPLYCGIIIYLIIMIFRNKSNRCLKKLFILILSLFCILLMQKDDLGTLLIKCCLFTTPFVVILFQRLDIIRDDMAIFIFFIIMLWGVLLITDLLKVFKVIDKDFYKPILIVLMAIVNTTLMLYFMYKCNIKYNIIITDITKTVFQYILGIIAIIIISVHIVMMALFNANILWTFILAFLILFSIHLIFVYLACFNIMSKKNYLSTDNNSDNYYNMLEDSSISEESFILLRLINLFESEKPYMNSSITVSKVASKIYTNRTYLSRALNNRTSKNFNQFVNYYRIKETCNIFINDPDIRMQQLYERCGFNSFSSFSSAFKINTGYTPAEWGREVRGKQRNNEQVVLRDYIA